MQPLTPIYEDATDDGRQKQIVMDMTDAVLSGKTGCSVYQRLHRTVWYWRFSAAASAAAVSARQV